MICLSILAEGFEQQPANGWKGVFNISSYTQYFDVDTDVVVNRLMSSLYPIGGDFFNKIDANPDLWVLLYRKCGTNIFIRKDSLKLIDGLYRCENMFEEKFLSYSNIHYKVVNYYVQKLNWKNNFIKIHSGNI